jgi:hypothetical protein
MRVSKAPELVAHQVPQPRVPVMTTTAMPDEKDDEEAPEAEDRRRQQDDEPSLVDELGVEDLTDILFGNRGRIFSAAGRNSPVAELGPEGVLLRPAQKPYMEEDAGEVIVFRVNEKGILLNELGEQRKIVGAKFKGNAIYTLGETKPGTVKHYAAWFDESGQPHKLLVQGEPLTTDMIYRIRNRTHDGEISSFPEVQSE